MQTSPRESAWLEIMQGLRQAANASRDRLAFDRGAAEVFEGEVYRAFATLVRAPRPEASLQEARANAALQKLLDGLGR